VSSFIFGLICILLYKEKPPVFPFFRAFLWVARLEIPPLVWVNIKSIMNFKKKKGREHCDLSLSS
jgi:hypothetical protein